ncbi:Cof-type HAD-IIB family hydrolase [Paenibacillus sp. P96]|uniref:Cof-type HAD-IIB family hydrolase n=1 Tax=Paenibacillus zeirhizosphaerae TaxID=2987519 RepID=A0ABT9FVX7_9BACL|nr:Cof-type HAD-IIB family hydrolase [Paenibacillus sp. P96]MDP4098887.1 Cof-type HAD-IIB family hydrolase [Paenibacillus sp. P96]
MKLIAVDLDGTLLNADSRISAVNAAAVRKAQECGIIVAIATGRAVYDVQEKLKEAGLTMPIISANGAAVHDEQNRLLASYPMDRSQGFSVLDWLEQNDYYYEVMTDQAIFSPQQGHQILTIEMDRVLSANPEITLKELIYATEKQYSQAGIVPVASYLHIPKEAEIYNILAFSFEEHKLEKGRSRFRHDSSLTMVISSDRNFEVEDIRASKGNALSYLANHLGVSMEETVAIGDSYNDISMLTSAGKGIAMGNAHDEIKLLCDEVTLTNTENGVAHAIEHLLKEACPSPSNL